MEKVKIVKIDIPAGYEIKGLDKDNAEVLLVPLKDVRDRIKTFEDVLRDNKTDYYEFVCRYDNHSEDELAYVKLKLIAKSLNEGWTPNWDDSSQPKYYPWFWLDGGSSGFRFFGCGNWISRSNVGSRLCFKSKELAEYAGTQFLDVYRDFMTL